MYCWLHSFKLHFAEESKFRENNLPKYKTVSQNNMKDINEKQKGNKIDVKPPNKSQKRNENEDMVLKKDVIENSEGNAGSKDKERTNSQKEDGVTENSDFIQNESREAKLRSDETEKFKSHIENKESKNIENDDKVNGDNKIIENDNHFRKNENKKREILFWTDYGAFKRDKPWLSTNCEYKNCFMTSNKSRITHADAVIMTAFELSVTGLKMPDLHRPWQKWVFFSMEPPVKTHITEKYNNIFNVTMTFRDDADVHYHYIQKVPLTSSERSQVYIKKNFAEGKTRSVAWMVSHCDAVNKRFEYVNELRKYIKVDIYGMCGPYKCGNKYGWMECRTMMDKTYMFYLAFENGFCPGYLTEKIWGSLTGNVLPVVMGGLDYSKYLPPNSFLDVRNFTSPQKLAEYMDILSKNDELYNSYFEWKKSYKVVGERHSGHMCELCKYLNIENSHVTYPRLNEWYNDCLSNDEYYKGVADMLVSNN